MARLMVVNPTRCIGCSTCALTCSISYHDVFDLHKSHIRINRNDFKGLFEICFASTCLGCKKCASACPTGALGVISVPDPAKKSEHTNINSTG